MSIALFGFKSVIRWIPIVNICFMSKLIIFIRQWLNHYNHRSILHFLFALLKHHATVFRQILYWAAFFFPSLTCSLATDTTCNFNPSWHRIYHSTEWYGVYAGVLSLKKFAWWSASIYRMHGVVSLAGWRQASSCALPLSKQAVKPAQLSAAPAGCFLVGSSSLRSEICCSSRGRPRKHQHFSSALSGLSSLLAPAVATMTLRA